MGGVCSGGTRGHDTKAKTGERTRAFSGKLRSMKSFSRKKSSSKSEHSDNKHGSNTDKSLNSNGLPLYFSSELKPTPPLKTGSSKVMQRNSFLGRAGLIGLERAVDVFDTLGSSVSNLNPGSGFLSGVTSSRGTKISILAFEVANTIAKGANLLQSLSKESLKLMKKDVLHSKGIKKLVSTDSNELLGFAASDKREELDVFAKEVVRFGNMCRNLQWHNLDRYFSKLDIENSHQKNLRDDAESGMQELVTLAQYTSELYHELQALDRFEQDYRRKLAELEALKLPKKGDSGTIVLYNELKQQKKVVRSLKKKSLWSYTLEEIMEKLVDIVSYIHQAITEVFDNNGLGDFGGRFGERLGEAGLALHYANLIQQIDSIVKASRPSSLPPNVRDSLYNALPASVKTTLRSRLHTLDPQEKLTMSEIRAEMEKSLSWLVPMASNTTQAHQGFGWIGEWANSGIEYGKGKAADNSNPTRLQTLYHADKQKTDSYVLELIIWLHRLMISVRKRDQGLKHPPFRSPTKKITPNIPISKTQLSLSPDYSSNRTKRAELSLEDMFLLEKACRRRFNPGLSKSQEFIRMKKNKNGNKIWALSRSTGNSPKMGISGRNQPVNQKANALDVLDGLDFTV